MFELHHVAISVKDIEQSVYFYTSFGFKKVVHWIAPDKKLQIAHLKLGNFFLELFCYAYPNSIPPSAQSLDTDLPTIGIKHFGLKVKSLAQAKTELIKRSFAKTITINKGRTGIDYFFIQDPNGIFIEIVEDNRNL